MFYIVSALRTILDQQHLLENIEGYELLSKVLQNNLSNAGVDIEKVDKMFVSFSDENSEEVFMDQFVTALGGIPNELYFEKFRNGEEAIEFLWNVYQQMEISKDGNYLIGALNKKSILSQNHSVSSIEHGEDIKKLFIEKSKRYYESNQFIDEIIPLGNIDKSNLLGHYFEDAGIFTTHDHHLTNEVNGAMGLLIVNDTFFEDKPLLQKVAITEFNRIELNKEELTNQIKKQLETLSVNEDWLIELDYFDFTEIIKLIKEDVLVGNIALSGGSIILGNAPGISGFRAIVALFNQVIRKDQSNGLALILNKEKNLAYFIVLKNL